MTRKRDSFIRRVAPALPFLVLAAALLIAVLHITRYW